MSESVTLPDFNSSVVTQARKDFPLLDARMSVAEALERIRREGVGERVIYFFAIDEQERLVGVLPTRRLLTAPLETRLEEIMVRRVVAIPASATILEACEFFVLYKFFAFPVVDKDRRVIGVVDVSLFAEELLEAGELDQTSASTACRATMFLKRSGFDWRRSAGRHRGVRFDIVSRGCCRLLEPAPRAPYSRRYFEANAR